MKSLPKKGKQDFCVDTKAFVEAGWVIQEHELEVCNILWFIAL
jgi:c-src tyrosine kinase